MKRNLSYCLNIWLSAATATVPSPLSVSGAPRDPPASPSYPRPYCGSVPAPTRFSIRDPSEYGLGLLHFSLFFSHLLFQHSSEFLLMSGMWIDICILLVLPPHNPNTSTLML